MVMEEDLDLEQCAKTVEDQVTAAKDDKDKNMDVDKDMDTSIESV